MKGLIRKRSTTAARLQRAFSAKSLRTAANPAVSITPSGSSPGGSSEMVTDGPAVVSSPASNSSTSLTTPVKSPNDREKRQFIMETSVQFINVSFSSSFRMDFDNVRVNCYHFTQTGIAESRSALVPLQRLAAHRQSPFWRSFQTEGQSAHLGAVAVYRNRRSCRRFCRQVARHFLRHRMAAVRQPGRHFQVFFMRFTDDVVKC